MAKRFATATRLQAATGAAALAFSFGKEGSIAVGVALAENLIQNDVKAYIAHLGSRRRLKSKRRW